MRGEEGGIVVSRSLLLVVSALRGGAKKSALKGVQGKGGKWGGYDNDEWENRENVKE